MKVRDIMTKNVEVIWSDATLTEASEKMKDLEIGMLPVCENGEIIGVLTDRDIVIHGIAEKKEPAKTSVSEVMTPEVFYCFEDDEINEAAMMMENESIHRLVVLDKEGMPVGMLSLADFAVKSGEEHLTWEILERISEPATPHR